MGDFTVKGTVRDSEGNPATGVKVFAIDSDQGLFEDHNDDLLGSVWVAPDGRFEISFSLAHFKEAVVEGKVDLYFIVRNSKGEVIARTEPTRGLDLANNNQPFEITVESFEKKPGLPEDPYTRNTDRTLAAFASLGDVATVANSEFARVFALLNRSIDAWVIYTQDKSWRRIGYDGPQVPYRPRDSDHSHKLSWEGNA